jgi:quercetin dioxygenase-like cupin family protein
MAGYTKLNLKGDVEDMAKQFGLSPGLESRFARDPLGLERSGVTYYKIAPGFRTPFGHRHGEQEEVYVVISGSARLALDDAVEELAQWDVIRIPGPVMRCLEGGPEGAEVIAIGAPTGDDAEMVPGWWAG